MEPITQLKKWKDQVDAADKHSYADMDVAKRLLNHALEAHDMIEQLRQFHHDQQELHEQNDALRKTYNIMREKLTDTTKLLNIYKGAITPAEGEGDLEDQVANLKVQLADKHQLFMCASANYDRLAEHLVFANDQITELQRERDELVADAKRYRYIRAEIGFRNGWIAISSWDTTQWENFRTGDDLDSAIDAALAKVGADKTGDGS